MSVTVDTDVRLGGKPLLRPFIGNITFDRLESFTLQRKCSVRAHDLYEMIMENKGLKKIDIDTKMTHEQMMGILDSMPKLKEISLYWWDELLPTLKTFLNGQNGLNFVKVHDYDGNISFFEEFIQLPWKISEKTIDSNRIVSFSRLN